MADVVIIGTTSIDKEALAAVLRPKQVVIDLVNLRRSCRPERLPLYQGICW